MSNPAICCIGYNRPNSMKRLLKSVGNAIYDDTDITLIISIDESDVSDEIELIAQSFEWKYGNKIIKRYPKRLGLKKHSLLCGDFSIEYGSVIFLEDDVVVAPGYYRYTKEALKFYQDDERVLGISLYTQKWVSDMERDFIPAHKGYDTYYLQRDISRGQCWIGKKWQLFKEWYSKYENCLPLYDSRIPPCVYQWNPATSWSKYISFFMVETNLYYVCPYESFSTNMSEVGTHTAFASDICQVPLSEGTLRSFRFGAYDETVIYDSLFERKDEFFDTLGNVFFNDVCIDLNGTKYDWSGYKYILTSQKLDYHAVLSFGINMEPIENNIIYSVPGNAIKLYKIPEGYDSVKKSISIRKNKLNSAIVDHIFNKYSIKTLMRNIKSRIIAKIKRNFYNL